MKKTAVLVEALSYLTTPAATAEWDVESVLICDRLA